MAIFNCQNELVLVNARVEKLFGYTRHELLGTRVDLLIPGLCRPAASAQTDTLAEITAVRKDGTRFSAEVSVSTIQTARGTFLCAAIREIAESMGVDLFLKDCQSGLRDLLDSLPQLIWTVGSDGRFDYVSPHWAEYTGVPAGLQLGSLLIERVHADDREQLEGVLARAARDGVRVEAEHRLRSGGGDFRSFRTIIVPIRELSGKVGRCLGSSTDIHDGKLMEAAQRTSDATFRQLANFLPQIAWTASPEGVFDFFNQRFYEYSGFTLEETQQEGWVNLIHPDDMAYTMERRASAFAAQEPYIIEYRLKRASDGSYRWHIARCNPVLDSHGQTLKWIGTATDIEGLKESETTFRSVNRSLEAGIQCRTEELRASEERLRFVSASLRHSSIVTLDAQGLITTWNAGAERMKGYTAAEMVGRHFSCLYTAEDIANGSPGRALRTSAEKGHFEEEAWRVRRHCEPLWADVAITAIVDSAGSLQGFSEVTRDITERRHAAQQLVVERKRAEDANRSKSDFLAAMSHEIRTPMNAILGMVDVLADSSLDDDQRQYVEVLRRAGSSLLVLINDILDLSKIEAGHVDLQNVEFNLEEVVDQAIELTAVPARSKSVRLLSCLVPGLTTSLIGDPTRLRQILINLLGNAIKFTDAGEVVLTVENHESGKPGEIAFTVFDTGIGIPPDKLETIFDDFVQAGNSTTPKYGGTGLGLGISRRLVESMNGHLTAASNLSEGSTFHFTAQFQLTDRHKESVQLEDIRGLRVLVIDDNHTNCVILRETLRGWGMTCDVFRSSERALSGLAETMASEQPYSMVLVDNLMPGLDGFETAAEIRRIASDLPIAMLTSDAGSCSAARRQQAGLAGYAVRPVKRTDLFRLVCSALRVAGGKEVSLSESMHPQQVGPVRALSVLVAEDSDDNRLLIQAYLKETPHTLTFAADGKSAVAQFVGSDFDLVLMDMHMPVMDGLAATRAIRALEREWGSPPTPIIALTANARPQDVELSRKAGCNAHLSKPISKQRFLSALDECGKLAKFPQTREAPSRPPIPIAIPAGLEDIVPGYLDARMAEMPLMGEQLAHSDFAGLANLGHNLKGTGDSYGFSDLTRLGAAIELSATESDASAVGWHLDELEDYLARVQLLARD